MSLFQQKIKKYLKIRILHTILIIILSGLITGCSTEKNTRASRAYHNLTSRYNIYFNGKESLKAGLRRIDQNVEDDYTRILPVYKESYTSAGTAGKSDMDNAILKGSKLAQNRSITAKPKRRRLRTFNYQKFASKEEFNNWVDDSYLLIGQAYFYQHNFSSAIENFSYVIRKFSEEDTRFDALVWLARSYSELERFTETSEVLQALQAERDFPKRLEKELAKVNADFYLKQNDYTEAIKLLEIALDKTIWKKEKARLQYILAQLYRETGNSIRAADAFMAVIRLNPTYKMSFNARINAAALYAGQGDTEKLKKDLNKMLRDEKNLEYRDQIYFALANIYHKEGNFSQAIDNYKKSVAVSIDNDFQKAQSAVTLADIFFDDRKYRESQAYYDTAMMVINDEYPDYQTIDTRYKGLSRLVENLQMVEVQDSLQRLAVMPENERNSLIDKWIALERKKQEDAELMANQQGSESGFYRANEYRFGLGRSEEGSGWYFYNPQTVSYGKAQFQQRWGRRKLEDNWRRMNKAIVSDDEINELEELIDSSKIVIRETDPMKREYYTQDLPVNDSLLTLSHEKIRDGLYNAGKIFKSDFNDYARSAESFEELNRRYPDNIYLLSAYFDLHDVNELMGDRTKALYYRDLIVQRFPDSKYARYLLNPNFFTEMLERQDNLNRLYQDAFREYKAGRYAQVAEHTVRLKTMVPDSLMLSKIDFMEAISKGATSDMRNFELLLQQYIANYPKAEPLPLATEILTLLQDSTLADYQRLVEMGYLHDEIRNTELITGTTAEEDEFGGKFSYDEELVHYFVITYPKEANPDINRLKFDLSNYNLDHYTRYDFDIEAESLDANTSMIQIRSLGNKEQALIYFRAIIRKAEVFRTLKGVDYYNFVISSTNYRQIMADKSASEYLRFFLKNYSRFIGPDFSDDEAPEISPEELMARAQREDELLRERGRFVTVDVPLSEAMFSMAIDTVQNFVIAVNDKSLSLRPLLNQFAEFNRQEFRAWNLSLEIKQAGDYQLVIIKGLPGYAEGMSYFRKVILERELFRTLGQVSYRNFVITDRNLERLLENTAVDTYMEFFRTNYIQRAGQVPAKIAPASGETSGTSGTEPPPPAEQTVDQDANSANISQYSGPYNTGIQGEHLFILVVPSDGFNKEQLVSNIRNFNSGNFGQFSLQVSETRLDDFRIMIQVSGLTTKEQAREFMQKFVQERSIFQPLGNADYRNFIITPVNLSIFGTTRNIAEYMEFYRKFYLEQ
jgi:tetratricopeptide (TPR) repeat protein